jgi:hypothetical protein
MILLDPQIASQYLGTLAQISGTILAVFIAIIIYVFQDRVMAQSLTHAKGFLLSVIFTCSSWGILIFVSVAEIGALRMGIPYDDLRASSIGGWFGFSLFLLIYDFIRIMRLRMQSIQEGIL